MKVLHLSLSLVLLIVSMAGVVNSQTINNTNIPFATNFWEQTLGPEGAQIEGVVYDASKDILFLSTGLGVFARYQFQMYQLTDKASGPLALTPSGDLLIADRKIGIAYLYSVPVPPQIPSGGTLDPLGVGDLFIHVVAVNSNGELFLGSDGLRKYDNGSDSWELVSPAAGSPPAGVSSIVFVGNDIYVGAATGVHKFDGTTWTVTVPSSLTNTSLGSLAYDASTYLLYAGDGSENTGIYSYNTMTGVWSGPYGGTTNSNFPSITVGTNGLFAIGSQHIYWKENGGSTFQELVGSRYVYSQKKNRPTITTYGNRVYATIGSGVRQSSPPYSVWTRPDMTIAGQGKPIINTFVSAMMKDPISNYIFAGTEDGEIFRTTNPDIGWDACAYSQAIPVNRGKVTAFAQFYHHQKGYERLFAARDDGGVYYSADGGYAWGSFNESPLPLLINSLAVYPGYEYNSLCSGLKQYGKLFAATEEGMYWSHCIDECDLPDADWAIVDDPDIAGKVITNLMSGNGNNPPLYAYADGQFVRSLDGGENWEEVVDSPGDDTRIAINSQGHLYALGHDLHVSFDNGATWMDNGPLNIGALGGITALSFNSSGQLFVAGEYDRVYGSTDNGRNWQLVRDGLNDATVVMLCPGVGETMLAAADNFGVWKMETPLSTATGCFDVLNQNLDLVGWWSGDNHTLDLTTNENDGSLIDGALYSFEGKVGQAFNFSLQNDFVEIPDPGSLYDFADGEQFSIALWAKPQDNASVSYLFGKKEYNNFEFYGYSLARNPTGQVYLSMNSGPVEDIYQTVGTPLPYNEWHFVVLTCDRTNAPKLYVDGSLQTWISSPAPLTNTLVNNAPFIIGNGSNFSMNSFYGDLDEVMLFRKALSQLEVNQLYNGGSSSGSCKPSCLSVRRLHLTYPNAIGIGYVTGTTKTITWHSECVDKVNIDYSLDDGVNWTSIATNVESSSGRFDWLIPNTLSATGKVRISSVSHPSTLFDESDFTFRIVTQWENTTGPTMNSLNDVSFISPTDGIAVGDNGTILYTDGIDNDGNLVWNQAGITGVFTEHLTGVSYVNPQFAWSLSYHDNGVFLKKYSHNSSWQTVPINSLQNISFLDVSFVDDMYGWMVGFTTANIGVIFATVDGGVTWIQEAVGLTNEPLEGVFFINRTDGYAVGGAGNIFKRTISGWQNISNSVPLSCQRNYFDISFLSPTEGWIVGADGVILYTNDGGTTWTCQSTLTNNDLHAISVVSSEIGWAVGENGTILKFNPPPLLSLRGEKSNRNLSSGTWTLLEGVTNRNLYAIDLVGGTTGVIMGDSGDVITYKPTEEDNRNFAVGVHLQRNWNMVSVPVDVADKSTTEVFPSAISNSFTFTLGGYQPKDTLQSGIGYWIKDTSQNVINLIGNVIASDTIYLNKDWNMIGSVSQPVEATTIIADPPDLIATQYFSYSSGYLTSSTIEPGKGYWVKANSSGRIILKGSAGIGTRFSKQQRESELLLLNRVSIQDRAGNSQSLFFGISHNDKFVTSKYEMPPKPPLGIFDARFASQQLVEVYKDGNDDVHRYQIHVSSAVSPLKISLSPVSGFKGEVFINGKKMKNGQELTLRVEDNSILNLEVRTTSSMPHTFSLYQNYPNPFNPTTTFSFELPMKSLVSLKVYNLLGQQVAVVTDNDLLNAGLHELHFDATNLASGVYFYRMTALSNEQNFVDVRKMILLK